MKANQHWLASVKKGHLTRFSDGHEEVEGRNDEESDECHDVVNEEHRHDTQQRPQQTHPLVVPLRMRIRLAKESETILNLLSN